MERREFIGSSAMMTLGLAVTGLGGSVAMAAESEKSASNPLFVSKEAALKYLPEFAAVASTCSLRGELCTQHCQLRLAEADTKFTNCLIASSQMLILCGAVGKLAAHKSVRLIETLDSCAAACKACKTAGEEHKAHWAHGLHMECKACAEQCDAMIAAITKLRGLLA